MKMDFIQIDKDNLLLTHLCIAPLKLGNKGFALLGIRFAQQFLAFFPTEPSALQDGAQGVTADLAPQFGGNPVAEFLQRPATAW